ncbi:MULTISPECIES: hypothetical protein [Neobacillus]|jgi:hypothetical protein|uniref:Uncharacterized protein n=2 Tax=Neobacillus TaxID=2675232 RepID=A0A6B3TRD9_9BACI|nr:MULTISPECIES: hypothetical protein [Neobacillus]MCD4838940.1 hypothetical protein [Neobacillus sedimentimangrovi]MED3624532.1 hypothetical protein [Neobacillus thermocopriae]MED3712925.1 hypothetical protein [Neobacillus thermocopriae]NEX79148.1 hypothetical protein [Neobacillus thermocopriae]
MNKRKDFPTREELDQAFHYLHDQINRISVLEVMEIMKEEKEGNKE